MKQEHVGRFALAATLIGGAILLVFFLAGFLSPGSDILDLGVEDGPVEWLAAFFWAATCVLCVLRLARGQRPRLLLVFWAVATFVFLGEEVSWFQRVLGVDTPEAISELNTQGEFNFHNLGGLQGTSQWVFQLGFLFYFLLLPLLTVSSRVRAWTSKVGYTAPHWAFLAMVWIVIGATYVLQALGAPEARQVTSESRETFFAFTVLAYAYLYLRGGSQVPSQATEQADTR